MIIGLKIVIKYYLQFLIKFHNLLIKFYPKFYGIEVRFKLHDLPSCKFRDELFHFSHISSLELLYSRAFKSSFSSSFAFSLNPTNFFPFLSKSIYSFGFWSFTAMASGPVEYRDFLANYDPRYNLPLFFHSCNAFRRCQLFFRAQQCKKHLSA